MGVSEGSPYALELEGSLVGVSIVIPVKDGARHLADQLTALMPQLDSCAEDCEVIVSDNGSTDSTPCLVDDFAARFPVVRAVDSSMRPGAAAARNIGAAAARGRSLVFLDHDDIVQPGWWSMMRVALEDHPLVAGDFDEVSLNSPDVLSWYNPPRHFSLRPYLGFLPYARTSNMGVAKCLFESLGGFDESWARGEDVEFSWRAQLAGHHLHFAKGAVVAYRLPMSPKEVLRKSFAGGQANCRLVAEFHRFGCAKPRKSQAARRIIASVATAPIAWRSRASLGHWARAAGETCGRVVGGLRWRIFM